MEGGLGRLEANWPGAHKAIGNFSLTNAEMAELLIAVERDGKDVEAVVADWIDTNENRWRLWLE